MTGKGGKVVVKEGQVHIKHVVSVSPSRPLQPALINIKFRHYVTLAKLPQVFATDM